MWSETASVCLLENVALELSDKPQAWALLNTILRNIVAHPLESKYRNVNKSKITDRILGGMQVLEFLGFQQAEGSTLALAEEHVYRVKHAVGVLDEIKERPLAQLRAQREAVVVRVQQKALEDARAQKLKPEIFKTQSLKSTTPKFLSKPSTQSIDEQKQTVEGLQRELDYLSTKIAKMDHQLGILHSLGSQLDFDTGVKFAPVNDFMAQLLKGPLWGVEMMVELLKKLQVDLSARYLLLKTHLSKLEEAPGSLALLFHLGYEMKDVALVMSPDRSLTEANTALITLQNRLKEAEQTRAIARQEALAKISIKTTPPSEGMLAAVSGAQARLRELQEVYTNLSAVMGAPFRIEWTIMGWTTKELTPDVDYACFPNLDDGRGRKWRAYARKSFYNKERDRIGLFLQCFSSPKKLPVRVAMHMSVLHRQASVECQFPVKTSFVNFFDLKQFTPEEHTWGFSNFSSTQDVLLMGALTAAEDKLTFRVDFCVQELPS